MNKQECGERLRPFQLRLPEADRQWVEQQATKKDRSLNWVVCNIVKQARQEQEARS